MYFLKRKASVHWGADPNEGFSRPRPVPVIIPLIDEDPVDID